MSEEPSLRHLRDGAMPLFSPAATQALYKFQTPLRDNLLACLQRRVRGVLLQLSTGAGKTTIAMSAGKIAVEAGLRGAWTVHRRELLHQAKGHAGAYGITHGVISADSKASHDLPFNIASIDTLRARLPQLTPWLQTLDFIIVDEAHHLVADGWRSVIDAAPQATLIGLTATPWRLDGRSLGDFFTDAVRGPSPAKLEAAGFLAPVRVVAPPSTVDLSSVKKRMGDFVTAQAEAAVNTDEVTHAAILAYALHCGGIPTIGYCVTVRHAEDCAAAFTRAGWNVEVIEGRMHKADRDAAIAGLASGRHQILFSVDCISEGTDVPVVGAGLSLRPTASTGLFLQQVGRTRRIYPGKTEAIWLDLVGNWSRHGMPNADRQWSLSEGIKGLERAVKAARRCVGCHVVTERGPERCPACTRKYPAPIIRPNAPDENALSAMPGLPGLSAATVSRMPLGEVLKHAHTRAELERVAMIRGYKKGWIENVLRQRGDYSALRRYG